MCGKCAGGRSTARARGAPRARPERSAPLHGFRAAARHPPVADPTARAFEAPRYPLRSRERIVYSLRFVRFKQMQGIGQLVYESNVLVMNLCDKEKLKKELLLSSKLY